MGIFEVKMAIRLRAQVGGVGRLGAILRSKDDRRPNSDQDRKRL